MYNDYPPSSNQASCKPGKFFYFGERKHGIRHLGDGNYMIYDKKNAKGEWDEQPEGEMLDVIDEFT